MVSWCQMSIRGRARRWLPSSCSRINARPANCPASRSIKGAERMDQLTFYVRHSLNDLRVNGQRTFFALLCIAAGVAAIVSLQTLAAMIGTTLTGNLQENNRGDIQFQATPAVRSSQEIVQQCVDAGVLTKNTATFFGQQMDTYT